MFHYACFDQFAKQTKHCFSVQPGNQNICITNQFLTSFLQFQIFSSVSRDVLRGISEKLNLVHKILSYLLQKSILPPIHYHLMPARLPRTFCMWQMDSITGSLEQSMSGARWILCLTWRCLRSRHTRDAGCLQFKLFVWKTFFEEFL